MPIKPHAWNVPGVDREERQEDWSIWSITEDVAFDGTCSRRKRDYLKQELPRFLAILEESARDAHPPVAPWHIPMCFMDEDELFGQIDQCGWPGYWFVYACKAADILQIPCPDERFSDLGEDAWSDWALHIDESLEHLTGKCDETGYQLMYPDWLEDGVYLGNRKPRKGNNLLVSTVPFTDEEIKVRAVASVTLNRLYGTEEERKLLLSE